MKNYAALVIYTLFIISVVCLFDQLIFQTNWLYTFSDVWVVVIIPLMIVTFVIGSLIRYYQGEKVYKEYKGDK